tara:strand:+ start:453 stop:557 length:105 start_codon:yes stop_codon:yes gene_type:complete
MAAMGWAFGQGQGGIGFKEQEVGGGESWFKASML